MRYYSNTCPRTELAADASDSSTSISLQTSVHAAFDGYPFVLNLSAGGPDAELVLVTAGINPYTVERGWDGTTPVAHGSGAVVEHAVGAADLGESWNHQEFIDPHGDRAYADAAIANAVATIPATHVHVEQYGAVGNGVTDDTAAIQDAIDDVKAVGAEVRFAPGKMYLFSSMLDCDESESLILKGSGSTTGGSTSGTLLKYTGTGSDPAVRFASSFGFRFQGFELFYTSGSFVGNLLEAGWSALNRDPSYAHISDCVMAGSAITTAESFVNLSRCLNSVIERCNFSGAQNGIAGVEPNYSNGITVRNNVFHEIVEHPVLNPGEGWVIQGNTFEQRADNTAGALGQTTSAFVRGLVYSGNWHGDVSATGGSWVVDIKALGAIFQGNYFATPQSGGYSIKLANGCEGITILGNQFESSGIDVAATVRGLTIMGNNFAGGTPINNEGNATNLVVVGNDGSVWSRMPHVRFTSNLDATGTIPGVDIGVASTGTMPGNNRACQIGDINASYGGMSTGSLALWPRNDVTGREVGLFGSQATTPSVRAGNGAVGFQGTAPIAKPTVTGSRGGNAALASLLTALANYGLITDSSSA